MKIRLILLGLFITIFTYGENIIKTKGKHRIVYNNDTCDMYFSGDTMIINTPTQEILKFSGFSYLKINEDTAATRAYARSVGGAGGGGISGTLVAREVVYATGTSTINSSHHFLLEPDSGLFIGDTLTDYFGNDGEPRANGLLYVWDTIDLSPLFWMQMLYNNRYSYVYLDSYSGFTAYNTSSYGAGYNDGKIEIGNNGVYLTGRNSDGSTVAKINNAVTSVQLYVIENGGANWYPMFKTDTILARIIYFGGPENDTVVEFWQDSTVIYNLLRAYQGVKFADGTIQTTAADSTGLFDTIFLGTTDNWITQSSNQLVFGANGSKYMTLSYLSGGYLLGDGSGTIKPAMYMAESSSLPAFTWNGDLNSGLIRLASDDVALQAGGVRTLRATTTDVYVKDTVVEEYIKKRLEGPIFAFGAGGGNLPDTILFNDSTYYGLFYNSTDTIIVTELRCVLDGTSPSVAVDVQWHATRGSASATHLNSTPPTITSTTTGDSDTSFDNGKIPPGVWVWCTTPTVITRPILGSFNLIGYRK